MTKKVPNKQAKVNPIAAIGGHPILIHGISKNGACTCPKGTDCPSAGKHPVRKSWQALTGLTKRDNELIAAGIRNLGWALDGEYFVVDVDGDAGKKSLARLEEQGLVPKGGLRTRTGSGGIHVWLKAPDGWEGGPVPNSARKLADGIDVRGLGGQVIVPPSTHKSGKKYSWENENAGIPDASPVLMRMITAHKKTTATAEKEAKVEYVANSARDILAAQKYLSSIPDNKVNGQTRAYEIACELFERGLTYDAVLEVMFDSEWNKRCTPMWTREQLEEPVRNAKVYMQNPKGAKSMARKTSKSDIEKILDSKSGTLTGDWVPLVNERYAHVLAGHDERIAWREQDGRVRLVKVQAWKSMMGGVYVNVVKNGKIRREPMASKWLSDEFGPRRIYDGVGVWPRDDGPPNMLNLWPGFPRWDAGADASCDMFLEHVLENVCEGNVKRYEWTLDWIAHMIQRPWEVPGVALLLQSELGGKGKSLFAEYLMRMTGSALSYRTADSKALVGTFNDVVENRLLVVCEEAFFSGDRGDADKLKSLITDSTLDIHHKGLARYRVNNMLRLICTSNHVVPLDLSTQAGRRWQCYRLDKVHRSDAWWREYVHEMEHGGPEALGTMLRKRKIKSNVTQASDHEIYNDILLSGLSGPERWLQDQIESDWQKWMPNCMRMEDGAVDTILLGDRALFLSKYIKCGRHRGLYIRVPSLYEAYRKDTNDRYTTGRAFAYRIAGLLELEKTTLRTPDGVVRCHRSKGFDEIAQRFKQNITRR